MLSLTNALRFSCSRNSSRSILNTCRQMGSGFEDKSYVVTGAGQGIGHAVCKRLCELQANVIALSQAIECLDEIRDEFPNINIKCFDLKDWDTTRESLQCVKNLDGIVNCAGIAIIKPFSELTEADFDDQFDVNVKAIFNVIQTLLPQLNENSSVVNISSLASKRSFCGHTVYSATKSAVDSLTRSLVLELSEKKIRFNTINPTVILTQLGLNVWGDPEKAEPVLQRIPMHRFGQVCEAVDAIIYLLSSNSSFVNGHHLLLDGGYSVS